MWLTTWSSLFEASKFEELLEKFPAFYGAWMFNTVLTTAHHWTLSWTRWTQSTPSYRFFKCFRPMSRKNLKHGLYSLDTNWLLVDSDEWFRKRSSIPSRDKIFSSPQRRNSLWEPSSFPFKKIPRALSPRVKHPRCSVQQSLLPPRLSTYLPYDFVAWCLIKHSHNFTFISTIPNVIEVSRIV